MSEPLGSISTMEILGGIAFNHPSVMSMVAQLQNLWKANETSVMNCYNDYLTAVAKTGGGTMSNAACALGALKAHPAVAPLIVQALGIVAPHIPETQQTVTQVQGQVMSAT